MSLSYWLTLTIRILTTPWQRLLPPVCKKNGHTAIFHDLYAEQFDPRLPSQEIHTETLLPPGVKKHCDEISSVDGIIIVHPNWWGQSPEILKGWVDRVIRPEVAYKFLDGDQGAGYLNNYLSILRMRRSY
jgi:putative NADPH-quinone reductase